MNNHDTAPCLEQESQKYRRRDNTVEASGTQANLLRPPRYTIDLSLPPEDRYLHIIPDFADCIAPLPAVLDDILESIPWIPVLLSRFLLRLLLRNMYDEEEDRELRGIAKATGLEIHLLVAMNILLDLFMGCTSGGVRTRNGPRSSDTRMLHFRSLDWDMDPLRKLIVELDYVEEADGEVIFTSVAYLGYVGCLTGLKKDLSIALNTRSTHDVSTLGKRTSFWWHRAMVLLGRRRGIASELRQIMMKPARAPGIIARELLEKHSTAAFITLSDGRNTVVLDNDNCSGLIRQDSQFIVAVNHDITGAQQFHEFLADRRALTKFSWLDMVYYTSMERLECVETLWKEDRKKFKNGFCVTEKKLINWMETCNDISNGQTHFGVIMDPTNAKIVWLQRYQEPLEWYEEVDEDEKGEVIEVLIEKKEGPL